MVNLRQVDQSEQARQQLVQRLRTAGTLQSKNIAQAFLATKREAFVTQFSSHAGTWSGYERGSGGLWETIMQVYHEWNALGRPNQAAYHVEREPHDGYFLLLCEQGAVRRSFNLQST